MSRYWSLKETVTSYGQRFVSRDNYELKYLAKIIKIKQNQTRTENIDICLSVIFDHLFQKVHFPMEDLALDCVSKRFLDFPNSS